MDPTATHLATLEEPLRSIAAEIITIWRKAGFPLGIVAQGARRDSAQQTILVASGKSRTTKSKHLTGEAVDFDFIGYDRNVIPKFVWDHLGKFGEAYGLVWGGRFNSLYDPAHFEIRSRKESQA